MSRRILAAVLTVSLLFGWTVPALADDITVKAGAWDGKLRALLFGSDKYYQGVAINDGSTPDRWLKVNANGSLDVNVLATTGTVTVSGTVTTTPPANASSNVAQFGGNNVVTGTGTSGVGIPRVTVSSDSSLTANLGTLNGAALDASLTTINSTLTGGSQKAIVRGALKGATAANDATVSVVDADHNALDVFIKGGANAATDTVGATVALNALNQRAQVSLAGQAGAQVTIAAGTCANTVVPEISYDGGTSWVGAQFAEPSSTDAGTTAPSLVFTNPNVLTKRTILYPGSPTHASVRVSAHTSGTCDAVVRSTATSPVVVLYATDVDSGGLQALTMKAGTPSGSEMALLTRCLGCTSTGGTNAPDNTLWVYGTTAVTPGGALYDTSPGAIADGNVGAFRMNSNRDLHFMAVHPDGTAAIENTNGLRTTVTTVVSTQGYNRRNNGSLGSLNAVVAVDTSGIGALAWEIDTGTLSGTVLGECTLDNTNWFTVDLVELGDGTYRSSLTAFGKRGWFRQVNFQQCRLRVSAYTSGTSNARLEASLGPSGIDPLRVVCSKHVPISTATTNGVLLVSAQTGQRIYVCGWDMIAGGTTNVKLIQGTTSTCATGSTDITGAYNLTAQAGKASFSSDVAQFRTTAGNGLCVHLSAAQQVSGFLTYEQF